MPIPFSTTFGTLPKSYCISRDLSGPLLVSACHYWRLKNILVPLMTPCRLFNTSESWVKYSDCISVKAICFHAAQWNPPQSLSPPGFAHTTMDLIIHRGYWKLTSILTGIKPPFLNCSGHQAKHLSSTGVTCLHLSDKAGKELQKARGIHGLIYV